METNQKKPDAQSGRRPQQGDRPRKAQSGNQSQSRRKEPEKASADRRAAQQTTERKRSAQQRPAQQKAAQERPARQQEERERLAQRKTAQRRTPQQGTSRSRARDQQTVLQGGPHQRAAKQPSPQQRSAKRQTGAKKPQPERTLKKNSLQSFISGIRGGREKTPDQEAKAKERRKKRAAEAERKRKQAERNNTPAVIYTAPQTFNRSRFLVQMITVMAVVVALIMALSVFFKVKNITVAGAEVYDLYAVRDASGIQEGDNLLTFSRERASAQIYAKLGYVEKVRIGIKLPDTVIIYIEEADVAYAIKSSDGTWWLMTSGGRVAEQVDSATAEKYTQVLGVVLDNPEGGKTAVAKEDVPTETDAAGEVVPVTVTGAQRLNSALQILTALEANDIVGSAASVDVSRLDDIILWYGSQYQVNLGDISRMEYKIACMNDAILQLSDYQSGILDVSFITWTDQVGYTPFG